MNFEWDARKNAMNIDKHGIDFADAYRAFNLSMVIDIDDLGMDIIGNNLGILRSAYDLFVGVVSLTENRYL